MFNVDKKDTRKAKVNYFSTLVRFEQTLHLAWVLLWQFFDKQVIICCGMGNILMSVTLHIYKAVNHAITRKSCQSYCKKFEGLFFRKEQGAIRTD